jgi:Flp pilus assembly pilin Flp
MAASGPVAGRPAFTAMPEADSARAHPFGRLMAGAGMLRRRARLHLVAGFAKCAAEKSGVTAIEYALIACIIVIAVAALVNGIGTSVSGMISSVTNDL